jgi:iron complex outermembrane receptor protein
MTEQAKLLSRRNQFAVGVTVDDAHVDYRASTQIGVLNPLRFVDPSPWYVQTPEASPWTATPIALVSQNRDYGIYVLDVIDLSSALSLTGSARYNVAIRDLLDLRGTLLTGHNRYRHLNPAIGATYQLTPKLNAYVGWSENSRTPTASEIECSDPTHPCLLPSSLAADPPTLRQVIARSLEAGLRGQVRLTERAQFDWNAGVFKTDVHDDIYGVATSLSTGFFTNIALTRREGFEAGFKYSHDHWSASVQWSDLRATFQSPLTVSSPSNPYRSDHDTIEVVPGNELPGIARTRLKSSVSYQLNKRLDVGVMVSFVGGSYYRGDESNQNAKLPGFQLVNVHASYRMSEQLQGYLMVNNVLNKRYANFGLFGDPTGVGAPGVPETGYVDPRFQSPGSPFALTAGVRFTF